jgi:hypothetical protein
MALSAFLRAHFSVLHRGQYTAIMCGGLRKSDTQAQSWNASPPRAEDPRTSPKAPVCRKHWYEEQPLIRRFAATRPRSTDSTHRDSR